MKRVLYSAIVVVFLIGVSPLSYAGEILLMFPKWETKQKAMSHKWQAPQLYYNYLSQEGEKAYVETKLQEFVERFEKINYRVDQIELWIEAKAESGNITKLFVSLEGSGGCKVTLKPKPQQ